MSRCKKFVSFTLLADKAIMKFTLNCDFLVVPKKNEKKNTEIDWIRLVDGTKRIWINNNRLEWENKVIFIKKERENEKKKQQNRSRNTIHNLQHSIEIHANKNGFDRKKIEPMYAKLFRLCGRRVRERATSEWCTLA